MNTKCVTGNVVPSNVRCNVDALRNQSVQRRTPITKITALLFIRTKTLMAKDVRLGVTSNAGVRHSQNVQRTHTLGNTAISVDLYFNIRIFMAKDALCRVRTSVGVHRHQNVEGSTEVMLKSASLSTNTKISMETNALLVAATNVNVLASLNAHLYQATANIPIYARGFTNQS